MSDLGYNETIFEHDRGSSYWGISTGEKKWKNKLKKLAEQNPDEVKCVVENDDGGVYYHVPDSYVALRKPRHVELTEEQRAASAERLRAAREKKVMTDGG